ncbi:OmpA family protein [Cellulophaga tyrosinoxydans]|uniref:OmpA family protein n=1 Tax=Cellulophaga tyrosinoxydans TaxID=504486 RepID=A0A1W1ZEK9_9FLAO|nr:OmpA family protein [Cellulophaga tyrosinoxydans]SMC46889.1 OmpA family protein [Cellulophaga tyrosinoxydans]
MKSTKWVFKTLVLLACTLFFTTTSNAQFLKKLSKKASEAAERAVTRKTEEKVDKETSKAMDSILNPGSTTPKSDIPSDDEIGLPENKTEGNQKTETQKPSNSTSSTKEKNLQVYSKFDFVPGDKLLFFDDFASDFIGDFPAKWNTNGTGQVVSFDDDSGKWFEIKDGSNSYYLANINSLPEDYTIEFDIETLGLDSQTSSAATLAIILDEDDDFSYGSNSNYVYIPFCQYTPVGIRLWNHINNQTTISNTVEADIRTIITKRPHISIAVNKQRYRLFVNETKYVDVPKMIGPGAPLKSLKFQVNSTKDGKERIFIKNIRIAEGGLDLRKKLIAEGHVSTNGILFDTGSANIQPQSMGIILQISQVLQQEKNMKLKIVGHTDSDGSEDANLKLSQQRADAVKKALSSVYGISEDRLVTEGKGETSPVSENTTSDGKAQNRRVEFVKI